MNNKKEDCSQYVSYNAGNKIKIPDFIELGLTLLRGLLTVVLIPILTIDYILWFSFGITLSVARVLFLRFYIYKRRN